ncbi:MAG: protein kinase [Sandaracinaceae bacterium]
METELDHVLAGADDVDPLIGAVLSGRYEILRRLGAGGMGAVYEARHLVIERPVAIKVLRADLARNSEQVARFRREATAAAAIGHKNIIDVIDMGRTDDGNAVYLVMERLVGKDWSEVLGQREADLPETVRILDEVLDALAAAHERGILHRDLKPANVFVCDDGAVKLLDFGVSKMRDQGDLSTNTGITMGTPVYMSPEQFRDSKRVDARADLYSVGAMLFEALTGRLPFEADSFPELAFKIVSDPAPRLASFRPELPVEASDLVERLLAKDPDDRPQSAREVQSALRATLDAATAKREHWDDRAAHLNTFAAETAPPSIRAEARATEPEERAISASATPPVAPAKSRSTSPVPSDAAAPVTPAASQPASALMELPQRSARPWVAAVLAALVLGAGGWYLTSLSDEADVRDDGASNESHDATTHVDRDEPEIPRGEDEPELESDPAPSVTTDPSEAPAHDEPTAPVVRSARRGRHATSQTSETDPPTSSTDPNETTVRAAGVGARIGEPGGEPTPPSTGAPGEREPTVHNEDDIARGFLDAPGRR